MKNKATQSKGFTLVEVIISIAILSILCVIFLQLFVKANDISKKSYGINQSIRVVNSHMEAMEGLGNVTKVLEAEEFSWMEQRRVGEKVILTGYLDESFSKSSTSNQYKFTLEMDMLNLDLIEESDTFHLYRLHATIVLANEITMEEPLYQAEMQVVFEK